MRTVDICIRKFANSKFPRVAWTLAL